MQRVMTLQGLTEVCGGNLGEGVEEMMGGKCAVGALYIYLRTLPQRQSRDTRVHSSSVQSIQMNGSKRMHGRPHVGSSSIKCTARGMHGMVAVI